MTPLKITSQTLAQLGPPQAPAQGQGSPLPKLLQSALIHTEDMNLPRFRRTTLTNQSPGHTGPDSDQDHDNGPGQDHDDVPDHSSRDSSPETPEKPKKRGRPKKAPAQELTVEATKRRRGRPKRGQEKFRLEAMEPEIGSRRPGSVGADLVSGPRRSKRTKSPSVFDETDASDSSGRRASESSGTRKATDPISLTKLKPNGIQRPLNVDIERLNPTHKDKRQKANTLDVLKHLISLFEPEPVAIPGINTRMIQSEFNTHLLDHIKHLADVHGSIDDLSHEITAIQKQKEELRAGIFNLRADHSTVGTELNKLRATYQASNDNYTKYTSLVDSIDQIKQGMKQGMKQKGETDIVRSIDKEIPNVGKLFNPDTGLASRLRGINQVLEQINESNDNNYS